MIELLLVADRHLAASDLDAAERIYRQVVESDPRNAIAVVGLARVAEARGDLATAVEVATRALAIDPDDEVATRLLDELTALISTPATLPLPSPTAEVVPVRRSLLARLRVLIGFR